MSNFQIKNVGTFLEDQLHHAHLLVLSSFLVVWLGQVENDINPQTYLKQTFSSFFFSSPYNRMFRLACVWPALGQGPSGESLKPPKRSKNQDLHLFLEPNICAAIGPIFQPMNMFYIKPNSPVKIEQREKQKARIKLNHGTSGLLISRKIIQCSECIINMMQPFNLNDKFHCKQTQRIDRRRKLHVK